MFHSNILHVEHNLSFIINLENEIWTVMISRCKSNIEKDSLYNLRLSVCLFIYLSIRTEMLVRYLPSF